MGNECADAALSAAAGLTGAAFDRPTALASSGTPAANVLAVQEYSPCLLEKAPDPFDSDDHSFEIKWDGFRALVYVTRQSTRVMSRWGTDLTPAFPELASLWPLFRKPTVVDGEIVVLDEDGIAQFNLLQKRFRSRRADIPVTFVTFDVLHYGRSIVDRALTKRQALLESLISPTDPLVMRSIPIRGAGRSLYERLCALRGVEGMVAKRLSVAYEQRRTRNWVKIYTPHGREMLRRRLEHVPRRRTA